MVAATLVGGCAPATPSPGASPRVSSAGSSVAPISTEFVEAQTVSFALDRIDQRSLPLDRTYRHYGTGSGVTVYVFDGGILDSHPELAGRVRRGFNAFPNEEHLCNAHGTAVAGAVAGTTLGVAPDAEIVDVKMVECRRLRGTIDAIVEGARWVIEDHARHPGRRAIANWSFIADTASSDPRARQCGRLAPRRGDPGRGLGRQHRDERLPHRAGQLAGRPRRRSVAHPPHRRPIPRRSLVDARTPGTAYGPCLDVFAPGDSVLLPSMESALRPTTQLWTGTSMSAGYVSGAMALYLQANPAATPSEVAEYIRASSRATVVDPTRSPRTGLLYLGSDTRTTIAAR